MRAPASPRTRTALIACGALAQPAQRVVDRCGWPVDVRALPPLLHNRPRLIAGRVREEAMRLRSSYSRIAVGYADCGSYGAVDEVCAALGLERLPGLHCYDVYAGASRVDQLLDEQPGTYLLTDFLVRSFSRTVMRELGLDRWPELREDYFGSYTRAVWLAQDPDDELRSLAQHAAGVLGLSLETVVTGEGGLADALARLVSDPCAAGPATRSATPRSRRPG